MAHDLRHPQAREPIRATHPPPIHPPLSPEPMTAVASTWRDPAPGRRFPEISWATVALVFAGLAFLPRAAAVQPLSALDPVEIYADGFGDLRGIVVDPQGNVFVTDRARGAGTRLGPDGTRPRVPRGLAPPPAPALDPAGRLLIAEAKAGRVVRVEANGRRTVV